MKKTYILGIAILLYMSVWSTYANVFDNADCPLVRNGVQKALLEYKKLLNNQFPSLLDEKAVWQALQNLYNSCSGKVGWAESNYLFDHLIDLGFRKLDAYTNPSLRYNLDADTKWAERQTTITEFADPTKNKKPEEIIAGFNAFRPVYTNAINYIPSELTCDITNTDTVPLSAKYKGVCEIAKCISIKKWRVTQFATEKTSISEINNNPELCDIMAKNRYIQENSYIKQLVARAWIRTITNLIEQYTKNYFIWTRRQNLYEQFTKFDQELSFVNRKVQEWTPVCSAK